MTYETKNEDCGCDNCGCEIQVGILAGSHDVLCEDCYDIYIIYDDCFASSE